MNNDQLINQKFFRPASFVAGLLIILSLLIYAYNLINSSINTFIKADGYYWVEYVIKPFITNGFSWDQIFYTRGPSDHVQPLTKALYLLNAYQFKLNLKLFGIIGYVSLLISTFLMVFHYVRQNLINSKIALDRKRLTIIIAILFYFVFFNYNSTTQYAYELILVNTLYALLIPIAFIISFDRYLTGHKIQLIWIIAAAFIVAIVGSTNLLYLAAALGTSVIIFFLRFNDGVIKRRALNLMISLLVIISAQKAFFSLFSNVGSSIHNGLPSHHNPFLFFPKAFLLALGATVISPTQSNALFKLNDGIHFTFFVGILFFFLILGAFYLYLKNKQYHNSTIPVVMLILYSMTIAGIIIVRGPTFGETCTLFPRYYKTYSLIYIGLLWIFTTLIINTTAKKQKIASATFILFYLAINTVFFTTSMNQIKYTIKAHKTEQRSILHSLNGDPDKISDLAVWTKPKNWEVNKLLGVQKFLKDHHLTFFAYRQEE